MVIAITAQSARRAPQSWRRGESWRKSETHQDLTKEHTSLITLQFESAPCLGLIDHKVVCLIMIDLQGFQDSMHMNNRWLAYWEIAKSINKKKWSKILHSRTCFVNCFICSTLSMGYQERRSRKSSSASACKKVVISCHLFQIYEMWKTRRPFVFSLLPIEPSKFRLLTTCIAY